MKARFQPQAHLCFGERSEENFAPLIQGFLQTDRCRCDHSTHGLDPAMGRWPDRSHAKGCAGYIPASVPGPTYSDAGGDKYVKHFTETKLRRISMSQNSTCPTGTMRSANALGILPMRSVATDTAGGPCK